ncbi:hypothetical protein JMUB7546_26720 [Staphylococcus aureus]
MSASLVGSEMCIRDSFILDFIFIIIMLFLVSLTNIFTNYLNKERKYKVLSLINVFRAGSMALLQIIFGLLALGSLGLIIGFSLSYICLLYTSPSPRD